MSVELELMSSSRAPRYTLDREKMKAFTRSVHSFASVPTEYRRRAMMEAGEFIADLDDPSDEELALFQEEVIRTEEKRSSAKALAAAKEAEAAEAAEEDEEAAKDEKE